MPEGFTKIVSIIIGAVLAVYGLFRIPSAVLSNSWGDFVISAVLLLLGIWILGWASKE